MSDQDLQILRLIDEGTAAKTGQAFFCELVQRVAEALECRYAFISRFSDDLATARVLAFWNGESLEAPFDYPLPGSPCEQVLGGEIAAYNEDVAELFPVERSALLAMGAVSYLAVPLKSPSGQVRGHLAVIGTARKNWAERDFGVLRIFGARAGAEIERESAEQEMLEANAELARRAALEGLITTVSTRFVTLEADDVDSAIETSLGEVARFAGSERARVFRASDDQAYAEVTHEWVAPGVAPTRDVVPIVRREEAPAVFERFLRNEVLLVRHRDELPAPFSTLRTMMERQGVLSSIIVPMLYGNRPVGAIAFHSLHHQQEWSGQDIRLLRLLGEIIAGAMFRREQERQLRHRLDMESTIAAISTRFVSADPMAVDDEIDEALRLVGGLIGSDRGLVFRYSDDGQVARLANEWTGPGCESIRVRVPDMRRDDVPEVLDHFLQQRVLNAPTPEQLPAGFARLNAMLANQPVRSRIAVPIVLRKRTIGILGFHSLTAERRWPAEDVRLLGLLGEIVGSALARRDAEIALQRARDAAEGASRAKSDFLANMSHELRTPLNGILGYAQLLRHDGGLSSPQAESVRAIERCGEHLLGLISDVLDLAKIESGRLELDAVPFDVDDLLRDVADFARVRANQGGLEFAFEVSGYVPAQIVGDPRKLRQVLLNLLGNAIKFTEHGTVGLRVRAMRTDDGRARLRFEVEDTGIGIPSGEMEHIFDPFQQVKQTRRQVEGTGLGLAICRRLVGLMGGTLGVDSEPGRGSRFTVEIEVDVGEAPGKRTEAAAARISGYAGRRRRILVVDDKPDNRQILLRFLRSLRFEVDEAVNGAAAVELATRMRPDLVFMDLVMPVMDGFEAIRRMRADPTLQESRIVALSASAFDATRAQSIAAGCNDFLTKPVRLDLVLDVLQRELGLHWLRDPEPPAEAPPRPSRAPASYERMPREVAVELHDLALMGDVRGLLDRLDELRKTEAGLDGAIEELEALGRSYDMKAVRDKLKPLVEAPI